MAKGNEMTAIELLQKELQDVLRESIKLNAKIHMATDGMASLFERSTYYTNENNRLHNEIIALKANSIPKCDGNHGGPKCRDSECWHG